MNHYLACWKKYAVFSGRATRAEYWTFSLVNLVIGLVFMLPSFVSAAHAIALHELPHPSLGTRVLGTIYDLFALASLVPSISVQVRRVHDTDRSGWWLWIMLVPIIGCILVLIWFCTIGTRGPNRYGSDPLSAEATDQAPQVVA